MEGNYKLLNINNIKEYDAYLNSYDEAKVNKFIKKEDRLRAIGSIILQKDYIQSKYQVSCYKDIIIQYTEFGKPFYKNLVYNVSHDSDLVIIVYSDSGSIGVDIMKYATKKININHFTDYFSAREQLELTTNNFISYWCAKEAFVKALGIGITIDMKTVEYVNQCVMYNNKSYKVNTIEIPQYCCVYVLVKI